MKYIMLAYTNAEAWGEAMANWDPNAPMPKEVQEACDFYEQLNKELTATGEFVATEGLADPSHTKTIRKSADGVVTTDGPYAEVKEVLVSYAILDCASHERVMEIAARVVDAVGDTVEVRPIPSGPEPF
ncbi:YciI family protein [Actinophytocola algeriensis]|jgi:hypothetical protein|uniref:YCII-related domain-containing protein n=1 Tax=Actinophytocola algeriensis TaxID=1768010 RepID=A0A7W7Q6E4_9PSEU|nr:YciI family protein [Actinophytocola algeriensis]MBB4907683.1 hypothetical protein [Actinophytocola algeriensis]MBE1479713.1 hypothetical protein [Actinophytocola algeriensis]